MGGLFIPVIAKNKFMKTSIFLTSLLLFLCGMSFAQISGTKTIPGNYATVAAAISALNSQGVGPGGVIFNVAAGHAETLSSENAGAITTLTSNASNPIVFQKSGTGANPKITAFQYTVASYAPGIIKLAGPDYVTFNGIDVAENPLNTVNKTNWGYAILMYTASDASHHINIKNCAISLNKSNTSSVGVYSKNHSWVTTALMFPQTVEGVISYCDIDNCTISNVNTGISFVGPNTLATSTFLYGQVNRFGFTTGNTITNFGGNEAATYGIYTGYQDNLVVANNNINGADLSIGVVGGIYINTAHVANVTIYSNTISLHSMGTDSYDNMYGIANLGSSEPGNNVVNIYGNIIENCTQPAGTGAFWYLLQNSASAQVANIHDNIIRNNTRSSNSGTTYLVYLSLTAVLETENIYNNQVYANTVSGTSGSSITHCFYCDNPSITKNIYSNSIYNNTTTGGSIHGIYTSNYGTITTGTNTNVFQNTIYGQSISHASGINYGLRVNGGDNTYVYNNLISDLKAPSSSSSQALKGISIDNGNFVGLYNNTVYLKGTGTGTDFGSSCVFASTLPVVEMKNNILANTSLHNGNGKTISYFRNNSDFSNYAITSGNNDLYAGTPGAQNLVYYDGTNSYQSLSDYTAMAFPAETNSFTELPPFTNSATAPFDLHINSAIPTQCESKASIVSTPIPIIYDYANTPRYPNIGYPNNPSHPATAPDAGAYEFAGIPLDITPPVILYAPLPNTSILTNRYLTASITDASGVPISGNGLPVCFWKINSGSYSSSQGVNIPGTNNYTFSFGSGVSLGNIVSYYIIAQDLASPPNVGANPAAGTNGFSANPPACSTPPVTPRTYTIIQSLGGIVTVGTGGTYPTLTGPGGLFQDINAKALIGNLKAKIISNLIETGENALNKWLEDGGTFSVTIQPDGTTERLITGNVSNSMIRFSGTHHASIDGRFNGSGKYLRFRNTNSGFGDFEFSNDAQYDTLRNCYWESGNTSTVLTAQGIIRFAHSNGPAGNSNNSILNNVIRDLSSGGGQPNTGIFAYGNTATLNSNNTISGNEILNFTAYGIYSPSNSGSNWVVTGNSLYNNMAVPVTTALRCIYFVGGSASNANTFAGNYIGGSAPLCAGSPWTINTTGVFYGLYVTAGYTVATEIYNNVVSNIHNLNTIGSSFTGIATLFDGLFHIGNLGGNLIGSTTSPNSILFDGTSGFRGIYSQGTNSNNTIENNIIGNISWANTSGTATAIYGITVYSANVKKNKIYKIGTLEPGLTPTIYGIYNTGVAGITNEYSNNIVDLDGGASANPTLYGFWDNAPASSGTNVYFNTFYVHGPATASTSTFVWRKALGSTSLLKNNIFYNNRASGGSGGHYGLFDASTGPFSSDYNDIYVSAGPFGFSNGTIINTFTEWKTITSGDAHSVSVNPNFFSATDYHPTNLALSNAGISVTGITTDYLGVTRGTPPDIGAVEFQNTPVINTAAATSVTGISAVLNGSANPFGALVTVSFEYGFTTSYGNTIAATPSTISGVVVTPFSAALGSLAPNTTYHFRAVGIYNAQTLYGNDMSFTTSTLAPIVVTLAASSIGSTNATLNGTVSANNQPATVTFEYGLTTSYGNTLPAVPGTVTGNTVTPVSADISSLSINTVYHFRTVAVNASGTTYGSDMSFLSGCHFPDPAGPVSGPTSICQSTNGAVFSVAPIPYADTYNWLVPSGATIASGAGTNSITVNFNSAAMSGDVTVFGVGTCGNGIASSLEITLNSLPVPTISGAVTGCAGTTGNIYSTEAGMTNYSWIVSGGTISTGIGTNTISISWNSTGSQTITVNYNNINGCSATAPVSFPVVVNAVPVPTISGENVACESSDYLDYTTEPGMTNYIWNISPNSGTISQNGTNVATVFWYSSGTKWVSVNYTSPNGCAANTATLYNVTVNPLPGTPGNINGQSSACAGNTGIAYSVSEVMYASTYIWTVPTGASIASGAGTNSITVDYGQSAISGDLTVLAQNDCGDGQAMALPVVVNSLPTAAGVITGPNVVCQGSTGLSYSIEPISGATSYNWTIPTGATIITGTGTNTIIVDFSLTANSGDVSVSVVNGCGTGSPSAMAVAANIKPVTPVISQNLNVLTSDSPAGNQWYKNGTPIPGAVNQIYEVTGDGTYSVIVTLNGCSSEVSNSIVVIHTGIANPDIQVINVYPNPSNGSFWLTINTPGTTVYEMEILNSFGAVVYQSDKLQVNGTFKQYFDLQDLSSGMYTLMLRSDSQKIVKKIVINK
jgi:trimeric autotransporter adhesin